MVSARVARTGLAAGLTACLLLIAAALMPGGVSAAGSKEPKLRAFLDGRPLPLVQVADYYCHDFAYPDIQCYSSPEGLETTMASSQMVALTAGVTYVTIYDYTNYWGSYMNVSEDYTVLATLGWNDRISSYIGRNYESGSFYTDWFYGGAQWNFCCNSSASSLGVYDNSFSSVKRT